MLTAYFITAIGASLTVFLARNQRVKNGIGTTFYVLQFIFAVAAVIYGYGKNELFFFSFDRVGLLLFAIMALVAPAVHVASIKYMDEETHRQKSIYQSLLIMLNMCIAGVYFSDNLAVNWIFLEGTTICTAGIIYHRRTERSLEATWKYIFVCSVGIAMAYLGILLIGGLTAGQSMDYTSLKQHIGEGNHLYMKIAFLFILAGYSCKLEIFPLYPIGVDGNHAAPSPASALISTALVNAGFVSIYRVYDLMRAGESGPWAGNVLIVAGILSVIAGAVFMRRTHHFKRLLSYSTVENMGIVCIALGLGGAGIVAAFIHVTAHSLIKSSMFLQIGRVGKTYGRYRMNRTGDYMNIDPRAAGTLLITTILLLGFPPSPLFVSEVILMGELVTAGRWWILAILVVFLCIVIYNLGRHILRLCYMPYAGHYHKVPRNRFLVAFIIILTACLITFGLWQPAWLGEFFILL